MAKKGPKPRPTRLRIMDGNPGKRPLNAREPMPTRGVPECPDWLDGEARAKWVHLVPELDRLGLLTLADGEQLAAFCQSWAEFRLTTELLQREGRVIDTPHGKKGHPAVVQQRSALAALAKFGALFGLSPADRVRLQTPAGGEKDDFESFLAENA